MEALDLPAVWFAIIAALFLGYFFLEGFDFGVGILMPAVSRDDVDRRVAINTIGPVWDANEVWLIVAAGAMFAAFPEWYATMFSGFYLPLLAILLALIARGVAFEYRGKRDDPTWRARWDKAIFFGSLIPAFLWGVAFASLLGGVPIDADSEYAGGVLDLLSPYALVGGVTSVSLFTLHGAVFLALKTTGAIARRAQRAAALAWWPAAISTLGFLAWSFVRAAWTDDFGVVPDIVPIAAVVAIMGAGWLIREGMAGLSFVATGAAILGTFATLFLNLYPRVMVSSLGDGYDLTIRNASSGEYTLAIMTWVAIFMAPVVLAYQGWSYWVFRHRVSREQLTGRPARATGGGEAPGAESGAGAGGTTRGEA